jgi:hypothetical protein
MTEPDAPQQENPRPAHHETLEEAAAEGPLRGIEVEDVEQRGEYASGSDPDIEAEEDELGRRDIVGGMNWPGE